jgi:DNA polymerase-3 subunit delta
MSEAPPASPLTPPRVYLLYGDDRSALLDYLSSLVEHVSEDPGMRELNTTRLDGSKASLEDIQSAAYALPFLTSRRLVIVTHPFEKIKSEGTQRQLIAILEGMPASTALVLEVDDVYVPSGREKGWQMMERKGGKFLLAWAQKHPSLAYIKVCQLPHPSAMPDWILKEAKRQGGRFTPPAAAALADLVGTDTGQARQEITKLLTYVDGQRAVGVEDVQELAAPGGQADVFAMVDSMALGDAPKALRQLGRLLEEQDIHSLFGMIVRQFRLLILTKEAVMEGIRGPEALAQRLSIHPKVAGKMLVQAQHYSLTDLEGIYHRLHEIDKMIKTGQIDPDIAIQTFVAELAV